MTWIQWIFHYFEIKDMNGEEKKIFIDRLDNIEASIQAFYLIVNKDDGLKMIDYLSDAKKNSRNKNQSKKSNKEGNDDLPDLLTDEEKELWSFMESQPFKIKETDEMRNIGKFILPTVDKNEILKSQSKAKIVEDSSEIQKPKLGFE